MRVLLRGVHLALTPGLKSYVDKHLIKPLLRFYRNEAAELDVQLCETKGPKGGQAMECRVTVHMPNTRALHVTERGDDLYKCISFARDRLERVAKRELERMRTPGHRVPRPIARAEIARSRGLPESERAQPLWP